MHVVDEQPSMVVTVNSVSSKLKSRANCKPTPGVHDQESTEPDGCVMLREDREETDRVGSLFVKGKVRKVTKCPGSRGDG